MKRCVTVLGILFAVACGGSPTAPGTNPNVPNVPTPPVTFNIEPGITVVGEPLGPVNTDIPFPTNVDALDVRSLSVRMLDQPEFSVSISFTMPDGYTGYWSRRIVWDFGDTSIYTYGCNRDATEACVRALKPTKKYSKAGTYTAKVTAENCITVSGERSCATQFKTVTVTVTGTTTPEPSNEPPAVTRVDVGGPYFGIEAQPITFTAVVSGGSTNTRITWNFGDGPVSTTSNAPDGINTLKHTFSCGAKTYPFTVTAGGVSASTTVTISVGGCKDRPPPNTGPPVTSVKIGGPYSGVEGQPITFAGSVSGGDEFTVVRWDYGDGAHDEFNKSNGLTPKHTYRCGTFTAAISAGGLSASTSVTVKGACSQ